MAYSAHSYSPLEVTQTAQVVELVAAAAVVGAHSPQRGGAACCSGAADSLKASAEGPDQ
jgi:hypothetical protein